MEIASTVDFYLVTKMIRLITNGLTTQLELIANPTSEPFEIVGQLQTYSEGNGSDCYPISEPSQCTDGIEGLESVAIYYSRCLGGTAEMVNGSIDTVTKIATFILPPTSSNILHFTVVGIITDKPVQLANGNILFSS